MVDRHGLAGRSAGAGVEVAIIGTGARVNVASSGHVRGRDLRTVVSIVLPDLLSPSRRPSWSGASGHKRRQSPHPAPHHRRQSGYSCTR